MRSIPSKATAWATLLTIGWLVAASGLYVALVMLELYWELYDWQPKLDLDALGLIIWICSVLVAIRFLARATCHRISQEMTSGEGKSGGRPCRR